jgi:hypothetical protein
MGHPAARAVHHLAVRAPVCGEVHHHRRERLDAFPEVARLGGPVIHLGVDVDGVFAVPRRVMESFQMPCKIRGLAAGPRTANQQIARELKIERGQLRIVAVGKMRDALVRRQLHRVRLAEVQFNAAESLMFGDVRSRAAVKRCGGGDLFLTMASGLPLTSW